MSSSGALVQGTADKGRRLWWFTSCIVTGGQLRVAAGLPSGLHWHVPECSGSLRVTAGLRVAGRGSKAMTATRIGGFPRGGSQTPALESDGSDQDWRFPEGRPRPLAPHGDRDVRQASASRALLGLGGAHDEYFGGARLRESESRAPGTRSRRRTSHLASLRPVALSKVCTCHQPGSETSSTGLVHWEWVTQIRLGLGRCECLFTGPGLDRTGSRLPHAHTRRARAHARTHAVLPSATEFNTSSRVCSGAGLPRRRSGTRRAPGLEVEGGVCACSRDWAQS